MIRPIPFLTFSDLKYWIKFWNKELFLDNYAHIQWSNNGSEAIAQICKRISEQKNRKVNRCKKLPFEPH